MANTGDLIEITDRQSMQPDVALNVYHYRLEAGLLSIDVADIAEFWWDDCNSVIRTLQSDALTHIRVTARNLDNVAQYGEYIIPEDEQAGTGGSAEPLSRESAVSVTFRPDDISVRPGGKRIAGIPENVNGHYGLLIPAYLASVQNYAAHMVEELNSLAGLFVLVPVIVGLPNADRPERVAVGMSGYTVNPYMSTQNTRKFGRGA